MTCVPEVETLSPGTCSARSTPAITERAALPVHNDTTCNPVTGREVTVPTPSTSEALWNMK